jgi:hypothetical protein
MIYTGYSGVLWSTVYDTLAFYNQQLAAFTGAASGTVAPSYSQLASLSEAMFETLQNGAEAINTRALADAWAYEVNGLQQIQALPLSLDPTTITYVDNRVTAYENAAAAVSGLVPLAPYSSASAIASGNPTIPSAGLLNFFSTFSYETVPSGLTAATLINYAFAEATAFQTLASAIQTYQGNNLTQLYDVANREYLCALSAANLLQALTSGGFATDLATVNTWNQVVTLPAMLMCADVLNSAPYTAAIQQRAVLRYAMLQRATNVATFLLSLKQPQATQVNLTTLRNGETLVDVAARALGDYTQWEAIAILNNLSPPYVGAVAAPGIATWGTQLVLPTPGVSGSATGSAPNYETNFLGVDLYVGPINGSMPAWTGDFQTIAGYNNLAWALGRRIQTSLGSLIFHPTYGSRIPPEVGAVQTTQTAGHITAFGKSALLSDPRTASVVSANTTVGANGLVSFAASVQPNGFESNIVSLNEVLGPTA